MEKCKDCVFWTRNQETKIEYKETITGYGDCKCPKFVYPAYGDRPDGNDCLIYGDYEEYQAWFCTGENFGCVHFKNK